jgi:hypothetical protein
MAESLSEENEGDGGRTLNDCLVGDRTFGSIGCEKLNVDEYRAGFALGIVMLSPVLGIRTRGVI